MPEYKASDLDQRVLFQRKTRTADGLGGYTTALETIATVWAMVRPMSGREREQAQRLNAESNYLMVIRDRSDIDETSVAVWEGVSFNIRFAKNKARARFLEIEVERGVAA